MEDLKEEILLDLLRRDYLIHAPKSGKELKREYPELLDYKELTEITGDELLFVWYWASQSSPLSSLPEEKRLEPAIDRSFPKATQREARKLEYQGINFPGSIKVAIKRMEQFNLGLRVQLAVSNTHLFHECQRAILRRPNYADNDEVEAYLKTAALARKTMGRYDRTWRKETSAWKRRQETQMKNLEGLSQSWHKQRS